MHPLGSKNSLRKETCIKKKIKKNPFADIGITYRDTVFAALYQNISKMIHFI